MHHITRCRIKRGNWARAVVFTSRLRRAEGGCASQPSATADGRWIPRPKLNSPSWFGNEWCDAPPFVYIYTVIPLVYYRRARTFASVQLFELVSRLLSTALSWQLAVWAKMTVFRHFHIFKVTLKSLFWTPFVELVKSFRMSYRWALCDEFAKSYHGDH